jgi:hypothetical protein
MNQSTKTRMARALCVGALIVIIAVWSWKAGKEALSHVYLQSAWYQLDRSRGQRLNEEEWTRVVQYLADSLHYSPRNPWALELMGALQLRTMRATSASENPLAAFRSAKLNYQAALSQRPVAPLARAKNALTKLYNSEQGEEMR